MRRYVKKNLKRLFLQIICVFLVSLLIAVIQPCADLCTFIIVPALAAVTVWFSGILVKGRHHCRVTDFALTSFFTTLTCSYAVTLVFVVIGCSCIFPNSLINFVGAFVGFYLPIVVKTV